MSPSDQELIDLSKEGNLAAFEQLVFRYDKDVLTLAARFTQSSEDAKDIYQEVFIRVYKGLRNFHSQSKFSTWLYRITTNVCLTHRVKKSRREEIPLDDESNDVADGETSESSLHRNELTDRIEKAMHGLSPKQRMVFTLRHAQELKLKEIAEMMSCTEGTIKKYLFEATQKMRKQLKDLA